jgi:hypothetical protein
MPEKHEGDCEERQQDRRLSAPHELILGYVPGFRAISIQICAELTPGIADAKRKRCLALSEN